MSPGEVRAGLDHGPATRDALLEAVASVAQRFLQSGDWQETVASALGLLGTALAVHRVYVFRNHRGPEGELLSSQYAEWTAEGVEPQIENPALQDVPFEAAGFDRWMAKLARGEAVAGPVASLPEEEQELLEAQQIQSLVVVPVFVGPDWWGFIGFDDTAVPRRWSAGELEALRTAASAFGHAVGRRAMEAALAERERWFRMIFEAGNDAIYVFGIRPDGSATNFLEANAVATEMLGYTREEFLAMTPYELQPDQAPGDQLDLRVIPGDGSYVIERVHRARDGTPIPVEISARRAQLDGRTVIVSVARDIRERKRVEAELREREAELRQAQKMEAVGRLAGGVAHDFNNLLTSIQGAASLALDTASDPALREELEEIVRTADRGASLTSQLLSFSRRELAQPAVQDANAVVREIERMLRRLIGEQIEFVTELAPTPLPVRLGAGELEQVLMNLAVNARDAMPAGGTITLRTSDADRADRVILTVEDDGVGMDPATRARAFEPFFTTKASAKGTGLGLSTVYGIVTRAGGDIELDTAPGKGTRFRLTLPRAESDPVTSEGEPEEPAGSVPADRTASILLVEDEASVRRLVRRVLRRDGHTVREAEDAADALRILDDFRPDLLLTDVVLPSGAGPELADEVDRRVPGVAVVLMSGYLEEEIRANGAGNGSRRFLSKPFSPADLRTTVARALA